MTLIWSFGAVLCILFALLPWIQLAFQPDGIPLKLGLVVLVVWSSMPLAIGVYLFFIAIRKTMLTVEWSGTKIVLQHLLPFKPLKCKEIKTECVYLAKHRQYGRRRIDTQLAVFIRDRSRKRMLANEHTCSEILELFAWLESAMDIRCIDLRQRKPLGDL